MSELSEHEHEHIEPGDPRYEGFRIRELWLLCLVDVDDNQEGIAGVTRDAAVRHSLSVGPAMASDERRAAHLRDYGRELAARGEPVALKHFRLVTMEKLD